MKYLIVFVILIGSCYCNAQSLTCTGEMTYLKINVHFITRSDGTGNFSDQEWCGDGVTGCGVTGYTYAKQLIDNANYMLSNNQPMALPVGNTTPVEDIQFRLVLSGVFFIKNDELFEKIRTGSNNAWHVTESYAVATTKEGIDVYILNTDLVNTNIYQMGSGEANSIGYAASNSLYLLDSPYETPLQFDPGNRVLLHELGHKLGLLHTFDVQQCNDTYKGTPGWSDADNNVMDYNAHASAWTPCQLDIAYSEIQKYANNDHAICGHLTSTYPFVALCNVSTFFLCAGETVKVDGSWRPQALIQETSYKITVKDRTSNIETYTTGVVSTQLGIVTIPVNTVGKGSYELIVEFWGDNGKYDKNTYYYYENNVVAEPNYYSDSPLSSDDFYYVTRGTLTIDDSHIQSLDKTMEYTATDRIVIKDYSTLKVTNGLIHIRPLPPTLFNCYTAQNRVGQQANTVNDLGKELLFYPNPSSSRVDFNREVESIALYDIQGRKVYEDNTGLSVKSIDVSRYTDGVYILRVAENNYQLVIRKQ